MAETNNKSNNPNSQRIEFYHDKGLMPDWVYYQRNGKSAQENYAIQRRKNQEFDNLKEDIRPDVERVLGEAIQDALDN